MSPLSPNPKTSVPHLELIPARTSLSTSLANISSQFPGPGISPSLILRNQGHTKRVPFTLLKSIRDSQVGVSVRAWGTVRAAGHSWPSEPLFWTWPQEQSNEDQKNHSVLHQNQCSPTVPAANYCLQAPEVD